jgi:hypothetical protein
LKTLRLEKGRRYPIEVTSESHALSGVSLVWKRIATDPTAELKAAAAKADVLVAVVGLTSDLEAEESPVEIPGFKGGDKTTLDLPADQQALLEQARALGKPLIVVAMNGSPLNFSWAKDNASALLEAWYPGQSGGLAIANVLTGKANPAGRLPLTFYRSTDDLPSFDDYAMAGRTYRYFEGKPVYPFGYGLSYTRFDYGPLKVEANAKGAGQGLRVTTTIRNAGSRPGEEVAQVYLNFPETPGAPHLALRGFQRVALKPGETREVTFALSSRDLSSVDLDGERRVSRGSLSRQRRLGSARHRRRQPLGAVRGRYGRGSGQVGPTIAPPATINSRHAGERGTEQQRRNVMKSHEFEKSSRRDRIPARWLRGGRPRARPGHRRSGAGRQDGSHADPRPAQRDRAWHRGPAGRDIDGILASPVQELVRPQRHRRDADALPARSRQGDGRGGHRRPWRRVPHPVDGERGLGRRARARRQGRGRLRAQIPAEPDAAGHAGLRALDDRDVLGHRARAAARSPGRHGGPGPADRRLARGLRACPPTSGRMARSIPIASA